MKADPAGEDAEDALVDVHDREVGTLPFVDDLVVGRVWLGTLGLYEEGYIHFFA